MKTRSGNKYIFHCKNFKDLERASREAESGDEISIENDIELEYGLTFSGNITLDGNHCELFIDNTQEVKGISGLISVKNCNVVNRSKL